MYQVLKRAGDPLVYMTPDSVHWYCFDPSSQPLGAGAMGTVYLGYNLETRQRVAVKQVRNEYANNPEIRRRAINEANLIFTHPNIVQMLGVCTESADRGPIFILSEFIDGQTFDNYVHSRSDYLPSQERLVQILDLAIPLLDALQVLHDCHVVHRDIKPSNIMIQKDGTSKLMDLGIAKTGDGGMRHQTVGFIGTCQYAAPELLVGSNQVSPADYRVDIYAFGVMLYELITGCNPFDAPTQAEVMMKQMRDPLPSTSIIPSRLLNILRRSTEKERENRYQSASQFKDDLESYLGRKRKTGGEVSTGRSARSVNKKPMLIAFAIMGGVSLLWIIAILIFVFQ